MVPFYTFDDFRYVTWPIDHNLCGDIHYWGYIDPSVEGLYSGVNDVPIDDIPWIDLVEIGSTPGGIYQGAIDENQLTITDEKT